MNVFELAATLTLDTKDYDKGLKESKKSGSSFASKLGGGLKSAAKIGTAAIGAVAGATAVLGKVFYNNANQAADYGDKVDKMSQKIGISAEAYQKWDYVMQRAGGSVDSLKMGMKTLSIQAEKNSASFQRLGISQEKVKNLSQEQLFEETIKGLSSLEAGTERTKLATQLLGRAGADLGPLLNGGSKAIEEQMKIAENYGMIMSDKAVKASANFKDSLTTLSMTAKGLKNRLMGEFLPSLTLVTDGLAKLFTGDISGSETVSKGISDIIGKVSDLLPKVLEIGSRVIGSLVKSVLDNAPSLIRTFANLITDLIPRAVKLISTAVPTILEGIIGAVNEIGKQLGELLPELIPQLVETILSVLNSALSNVDSLIETAMNIVNGLIAGLLQAIPVFAEKLPSIIGGFISAVLDSLPLLIQGVIQLFNGIVAALPEIITSLISAIPSIITSVISALTGALPQLIQGVVQLVLALVENLPTIILALIEAIPTIIESIIDGFIGNIDKLVEGAIQLVIELVKHLPEIILGLIKAIPSIIVSIVKAFSKGVSKFFEIGVNLIKGLWDGIVSVGKWLWDKISGFFGGIVDGIKDFFGIHSPARLFRDQIGKMLALGVGVGFTDEMPNVIRDMENALPDSLSTDLGLDMYDSFSGVPIAGSSQQSTVINNEVVINSPQFNSEQDMNDLVDKINTSLGQLFAAKDVAYG
jgi:hypothetical protein